VERSSFAAEVPGGSLGGWVSAADGLPVLLLHGGPGMSFRYADGLAEEIGAGFRVGADGIPVVADARPSRFARSRLS